MSISKRQWEEYEEATRERRGYPPLLPINAARPSPEPRSGFDLALWAVLLIALIVMLLGFLPRPG